ncbi:unnamed protein product [Kuraishia capsulata CBS 1993]|uniref:Uncharacterized protein n=1 Tax=Kuraishia capsulata CBS 1993 TaxID=1382522 RepID=W6MTE9_9ASCO|nr:uncharacterized protein KUCA_T00000977001 [Kuraishia capsulata CBS 1993]CDK25010.1 unnamed protein product [Kuraishia capsulata CBS 1993]
MSRASKITFRLSLALSAGTAIGVYYLQQSERDALKLGPIKDAARVAERRKQEELTSKQKANVKEFELQQKLRAEFESVQPLSGEIIEGLDQDKK